jgi:hypothetical protein
MKMESREMSKRIRVIILVDTPYEERGREAH